MDPQRLKYLEELQQISKQPCPSTNKFKEDSTIGFRIMNNPATLLPGALTSPRQDGTACEHWSLSFFNSLGRARKLFKNLKGKGIDVVTSFGNHIGEVTITPDSGVCNTPSTKSGHFDLHEYSEVDHLINGITYHNAEVSDNIKDEGTDAS